MKKIDLEDLKEHFEADKKHNAGTRQEAQDLMYFYMISHYTDDWRQQIPLKFQGQFDNIKKAGRKIIADLISQEVQADFAPRHGTSPELSELADKLYRTDITRNISIEAYENATMEQVPCGIGGWRWVNRWESNRLGDRNQVLERVPIHEYNARVFWDECAKLQDKSDAKRVHIITGYSEDGYEELKEELTGEEDDDTDESDNEGISDLTPERGKNSVAYDSADVYVCESYYKFKEKITVIFFEDDSGQVFAYEKAEAKKFAEQLAEEGKRQFDSRKIEVDKVKKYTWTSKEILSEEDVAGQNIPVVVAYGERAFVNGVEHYEGITRGVKDQAMLRNTLYSYMADIAINTPRSIPSYFPEQIAGYEHQYADNGADSNLPYRLQHRKGDDGLDLPIGPVSFTPPPELPPALIAAIGLTNETIQDAAQSAAPNSISDVTLSGNAISEIRAMLDENSIIFRRGAKNALRRDAEIWMGMAPAVYGIERQVVGTSKDGKTEEIWVNRTRYNIETGKEEVLNDLSTAAFEVTVELSQAFGSQRQQERAELAQMLANIPPGTPEHRMLLFKYFTMTDSSNVSDIKKYALKQLLLDGVREPENDEDEKILADAQQSQGQPDPNMALAMAEQMKAENQAQKTQLDHRVDVYNAETQRIDVLVKAEQANASNALKQAELVSKRIDSAQKMSGSQAA